MSFGSGETGSSGFHRFGIKFYSGSILAVCSQPTVTYDDARFTETIPTETVLTAVGVFDGRAPTIKLFYNGKMDMTILFKKEPIRTNGGPWPYKIGNGDSGDSTREFDGDVSLAAVWHDRALTDSEAFSLLNNPWQIFKSQRITMPIFP